jgi:acetyl esterase/lipase
MAEENATKGGKTFCSTRVGYNRQRRYSPNGDPYLANRFKGHWRNDMPIDEPVGGNWFPTPLKAQAGGFANIDVVLHLHSSAFVLGDDRIDYSRFQAGLLTKNLNVGVFSLQYRFATNSSSQFPAALQDVISAYLYLLGLEIPTSNIILLRDSAGANPALALLRYIADNENSFACGSVALVPLDRPHENSGIGLAKANPECRDG